MTAAEKNVILNISEADHPSEGDRLLSTNTMHSASFRCRSEAQQKLLLGIL
jgi:hypothetical protein